jgi:serine/threonine-protein kinase HipA
MNEPVAAEVVLWGTRVGAVAWDVDRGLGFFEYDPEFVDVPIEIAPLTMHRSSEIYSFPELSRQSFHGLPGLIADSLPDKFGTILIDRWLEEQGRSADSFSPVERLCYMGSRGMGALEFRPTLRQPVDAALPLAIGELVRLANVALSSRRSLEGPLSGTNDVSDQETLSEIISVGTSAGGARAKAVVAWKEETNEVVSGQTEVPPGFEHWILKFDGVASNADKELADPLGFGRVEYAYSQMAKASGIEMTQCRLLEENTRAHFMTKRFDRSSTGTKLHMQSLCAIAHYDFNQAGAYSYEQSFGVTRKIVVEDTANALEQLVRRMVFNVVARNQDDHTKNIAFLMNRDGRWSLAPAFDMTYSFNPDGDWTSRHQMRVNDKRDGFSREDLVAAAAAADLRPRKANAVIDETLDAVRQWATFAEKAGVPDEWAKRIAATHRLLAD